MAGIVDRRSIPASVGHPCNRWYWLSTSRYQFVRFRAFGVLVQGNAVNDRRLAGFNPDALNEPLQHATTLIFSVDWGLSESVVVLCPGAGNEPHSGFALRRAVAGRQWCTWGVLTSS